jgi:hypothetical protein
MYGWAIGTVENVPHIVRRVIGMPFKVLALIPVIGGWFRLLVPRVRRTSAIVLAGPSGVLAVPPPRLRAALSHSLLSDVVTAIVDFQDTMDQLEAVSDVLEADSAAEVDVEDGVGLAIAAAAAVGGAAMAGARALKRAQAEKAMTKALESVMREVQGRMPPEQIFDAFAPEASVLLLPRQELISVSGATAGLMTKRFEVDVVHQGFWIFKKHHRAVFKADMIENGQRLLGAASTLTR